MSVVQMDVSKKHLLDTIIYTKWRLHHKDRRTLFYIVFTGAGRPTRTKHNIRRTLSSEDFIAAYYSMFLDSDAIFNASTFNLQRYVTHQIK